MTAPPALSFIIPTLNEAQHIGDVIRSIRMHAARLSNEIIVVDNGSSDETVEIARQLGAEVLNRPGVTVAALRNAGAASAHAEIYVFLDGDVLLTERWGETIVPVLASLLEDSNVVTGSRCGIGRSVNWIQETWFKPLLSERPNYINSGHLITTRALFHRLNGFDSRLETGEDYDFSQRARGLGARIFNNPSLEVIHEGYPDTLERFVRREIWHGRGNFQPISAVVKSKIGPMTLLFLLLHVTLLCAAALGYGLIAVMFAISIASFCLFVSWAKYRRPMKTVAINSYLYYWYFFGRVLALLGVLLGGFRALTRAH